MRFILLYLWDSVLLLASGRLMSAHWSACKWHWEQLEEAAGSRADSISWAAVSASVWSSIMSQMTLGDASVTYGSPISCSCLEFHHRDHQATDVRVVKQHVPGW